jgi:hypothetical protein
MQVPLSKTDGFKVILEADVPPNITNDVGSMK